MRERRTNGPVQPPQLVPVETGRGPEGVQAGAPKRLVHVDVPHACERALVEERRLQRRTADCETLAEPHSGEEGVERLVPHPRGEIRLGLSGLQQKPGAEAAHVSVCDIRAVV